MDIFCPLLVWGNLNFYQLEVPVPCPNLGAVSKYISPLIKGNVPLKSLLSSYEISSLLRHTVQMTRYITLW